MMSDSRKRKLQMLTQSLLRGDIASAQRMLNSAAGSAGAKSDSSSQEAATPQRPVGPVLLEDACPGCEFLRDTQAGRMKHWLIRRKLKDLGDSGQVAARYAAVLRGARQRLDELEASVGLCHAANSGPQDVLFMDIETCGLAGTAIFLVGTMLFEEEDLVFEQHLARDYSEEASILDAFASQCERFGLLVTFNGKAFDMNQIRERCIFHGIDSLEGSRLPHLDLLQESRKRWRKQLPNCRLQTLEQYFCRRRREGDIPGWAIPEAYHNFVSSRDARAMRDILHHNLLDLLTMAELLCAALTGSDPVGGA